METDPCQAWIDTDTKTAPSNSCITHEWEKAGCLTKPPYLTNTTDEQKAENEKFTHSTLVTDITDNWVNSVELDNIKACYGDCSDWVEDSGKTELSDKCVKLLWEKGTDCEAEPTHFYKPDDTLLDEYKKMTFEKFKKRIQDIAKRSNFRDEYKCNGSYSSKTIMIFIVIIIITGLIIKTVVIPKIFKKDVDSAPQAPQAPPQQRFY